MNPPIAERDDARSRPSRDPDWIERLARGLAVLSGLAVRDVARMYLEALAGATGRIVNLSALDDTVRDPGEVLRGRYALR